MNKIMKRICWTILGGLIFCAVIFHHAFLTFLATWSLQVYSVSKWGKPLQYENLFLTGNQIVIIQPRFEHESFFKAERMALDFQINIWKRQLHIEIEIDQPHWHFQTPITSQWEKWSKFLNQEKEWLKTYPHFHVKKGLLTWVVEDLSQRHQLKFDLEINNQEGGYLKFDFSSPESSKENFLVLQTLKANHGVEVECSCEKIDCPSFIDLVQFLGIDFSPWQIKSGTLQGRLKAIFPEMQRPYLEGELIVDQLALNGFLNALECQIGQARLQLEKNEIAYELNNQIPTTIGKLEILEPASLLYHTPVNEWSMHQIKGSVQLNDRETVLIDLQAQGGDFHQPSHWNLQGKANLNAQRSLNLDLALSCSSQGQPNGTIHFAINQQPEGLKHVEVQCTKLAYTECHFLQTLLASYYPIFNEVLFEDGEFNALVEADLMHQGIGMLNIKQFEATNLRSKLKTWNMACNFGQVKGYGQVELGREDFWKSIDAGLHLEDGKIQFEDLSPPLPMTGIQANVVIQKGHVEHSLVTLQIAGLKGNMDVEWGEQKQLLTFKLDGIAQDLADLFPGILQEGLRKHFYHNRLMVLANLKRQHQQIELGGTLHIQRANTDQMDLVHFGCELKKIQGESDSKYIPVGWFHAQNLPLDKFLSPFIFRNGILQMSGEAEFKGSFDDRLLLIKYGAEHLKIENEDLCIEIPRLNSSVPGQLVGSHQVDLRTYDFQGSLPIQSASYFEKNTGLLFQDIQGLVNFKKDFIRILPIEAYGEGIYFAGELELDYSDPAPGVFDLTIHCPTLSGKVSQIQYLLAHLDQPSLLNKIPLEGEVTGKEEGLRLKFNFVPQDYHLQADVRGIINDGAISFEEADMALRGIYMDVDYHHQRQLLEFSDIQGTLLVGKPRRVEEFLFTGHHIHFHQLTQPDIDVDISIRNQERELLRLVGYTQNEREGVKSLRVNQNLSHLSCIYPHVWQCQLRDWSNIEQFELHAHFDLGKFLEDLKSFRQTGLLFLSHSIIDKISQFLPVEGQGFLSLRSQPDQTYLYHLEGSHIKQGNSAEHFGLLKGSKQDKKWIIDQMQWDDLSAYAELHQTAEKWRIPFLGLKVGQTLLLGLDGEWLHDEGLLKAKLKFCEVDLAKLDHFENMQAFVTKWWPKGVLNATGEIEWNLLATHPLEGLKASLLAEVSNFTLRDCPFKIVNTFQMKLQPHHSFCLGNVQVEFASQKRQAYLDIKQFQYHSPQDIIHSLEAVFQIPHHQLQSIGDTLHHHFPEILDASVKELLIAAKQQGQLKGKLTIENCKLNQNLLRIELEDGLYSFKKREYDLKQFKLQIVGEDMQISALSQEERCPFQILGQTKWPSCQHVQCRLTSLGESNPLVINWENRPGRGLTICSLQGEFNGCSFLLKESHESMENTNSEWAALQGQVSIDFNRLSSLLALPIADTIQKLKIGSPYCFAGQFWINSDWGTTFLETLSFKGKLLSEEAIVKGYQIKNFEADVQYVPGRLDIQNLVMQDPAGTIKAANCVVLLDSKEDKWTFFIPRLTVKNLRFNLLRDIETYAPGNSKFRSLTLKKVEFQDFQGDLGQIHTWQTQGNLHFMNPSKKHPFHPIFAIPAEIILRLGLDPHVLNPVTGIIYFNLRGERFYLTRFKDVYSEGRGSKFYLAQGSTPSWMDFDGNLSVRVRMKQYNLIFKIAELFTVSIQGNIKKPRYTLQKQSKSSRKPVIAIIPNQLSE